MTLAPAFCFYLGYNSFVSKYMCGQMNSNIVYVEGRCIFALHISTDVLSYFSSILSKKSKYCMYMHQDRHLNSSFKYSNGCYVW